MKISDLELYELAKQAIKVRPKFIANIAILRRECEAKGFSTPSDKQIMDAILVALDVILGKINEEEILADLKSRLKIKQPLKTSKPKKNVLIRRKVYPTNDDNNDRRPRIEYTGGFETNRRRH